MSESKQPLSDFDGLPSSKPIDVQELAAEEKWLDEQASRPAYKRAFAFLRKLVLLKHYLAKYLFAFLLLGWLLKHPHYSL